MLTLLFCLILSSVDDEVTLWFINFSRAFAIGMGYVVRLCHMWEKSVRNTVLQSYIILVILVYE